MLKKFIFTGLAIVVIVGALFLAKRSQFQTMGAAGAAMVIPPETVTATAVKEAEWQDMVTATGSVAAVQGVVIGAEMPGKVTKISFEAGSVVKAGDVLVELDTTTEEAQLRAAEASAQLTRANVDRSRDLAGKSTISKAELDAAEAQFKQASAQADGIRAIIAKKTIKAPFAGRLGLRQVNLGQILKEGDPIATLQTLNPVYVNFSVPQQRLAVLSEGVQIRATTDAAPDQAFDGKITAVSPEIDPATRNVRVQATVNNDGEKLRAGMFANVEVLLSSGDKVLIIPATAVSYAPFGDSVFVIDDKKDEKTGKTQKVLRQQFIRLGPARGDFVSVASGLKAGESIVTSGVFKLRPGMEVVIDNKLAPSPELAPKPDNT